MDKKQNPDREDWLDQILNQSSGSDEALKRILEEDMNSPSQNSIDNTTLYTPHGDPAAQERWENYVWKSKGTMDAHQAPESPEPSPAELDYPLPEEPEEQPEEESVSPVPEDVPPEEPSEPVQKGRPGFRKGYGLWGIPHILATLIWLAIILAVGVSLGRTIWVCTADLMAFGKPDHEVVISIVDGDTIDTVAKKLADASLVRYPGLFKTFATLTGKDERISVGTFTLNSKFDYNAMINAMGSYAPAREEVEVVISEGFNCAQVFKLLEDNKVCSAEKLGQWAAEGELKDYWFMEYIERGSIYCLEGYLAPDTYKFYTNDDPQRVLEKLLNEFDDRFTEKMQEEFQQLQERYANALAANGADSSYIENHPLDLNSIVTLASIIDRETSSGDESYQMASVFFNRMTNPNNYPHLESKATVRYAIGDYFSKKTQFSEADYAYDSPYNTFVCEGLPVRPICNPSVNSIYAALDPDETSYYFYVYDLKEQRHLFASSLEGHQQNVAKVEAETNE